MIRPIIALRLTDRPQVPPARIDLPPGQLTLLEMGRDFQALGHPVPERLGIGGLGQFEQEGLLGLDDHAGCAGLAQLDAADLDPAAVQVVDALAGLAAGGRLRGWLKHP